MNSSKAPIPIKKDAALWYMVINAFVLFLLPAFYYNHEEFGFSGAQYGLGIFLLVFFPVFWIILYVVSDIIKRKNEEIERLKQLGAKN